MSQAIATVLLRCGRQNCLKRSDDCRIKLALDGLSKTKPSNLWRHCIPIWPVGGHRIVRVRYGKNPRDQWDVVPSEAVRITIAVNAFVMVANDRCDGTIVLDLLENSLANDWVFLHDASLLKGKGTRLLEEAGRKSHLPDVVY